MAPLRDGGLVIGDNARLEAILHPSRRLDTLSRGSGRWTTIHGEHRRVNASPTILLCELDLGLFLAQHNFGKTEIILMLGSDFFPTQASFMATLGSLPVEAVWVPACTFFGGGTKREL